MFCHWSLHDAFVIVCAYVDICIISMVFVCPQTWRFKYWFIIILLGCPLYLSSYLLPVSLKMSVVLPVQTEEKNSRPMTISSSTPCVTQEVVPCTKSSTTSSQIEQCAKGGRQNVTGDKVVRCNGKTRTVQNNGSVPDKGKGGGETKREASSRNSATVPEAAARHSTVNKTSNGCSTGKGYKNGNKVQKMEGKEPSDQQKPEDGKEKTNSAASSDSKSQTKPTADHETVNEGFSQKVEKPREHPQPKRIHDDSRTKRKSADAKVPKTVDEGRKAAIPGAKSKKVVTSKQKKEAERRKADADGGGGKKGRRGSSSEAGRSGREVGSRPPRSKERLLSAAVASDIKSPELVARKRKSVEGGGGDKRRTVTPKRKSRRQAGGGGDAWHAKGDTEVRPVFKQVSGGRVLCPVFRKALEKGIYIAWL